MDAVQTTVRGIKCDAPGCDYSDMTAEFSEAYLNQPCPKCGANLLTEKDLALVKALFAIGDLTNKIIGQVPDDTPLTYCKVKMDGSGIPSVIECCEPEED